MRKFDQASAWIIFSIVLVAGTITFLAFNSKKDMLVDPPIEDRIISMSSGDSGSSAEDIAYYNSCQPMEECCEENKVVQCGHDCVFIGDYKQTPAADTTCYGIKSPKCDTKVVTVIDTVFVEVEVIKEVPVVEEKYVKIKTGCFDSSERKNRLASHFPYVWANRKKMYD